MRIAVLGSGYVGLTTGACLAETGNDVVCADIVQEKVDALNRGEIPFFEPGLAALVEENVAAGRLTFTADNAMAVRESYIVFIAVGTPPGEDGSADLRHVLAAARDVGRAMDGERIVITKSTVPVGTARMVREAIEAETEHPVHVCCNPEFLKEGAAISDFKRPDRVVLGVDDSAAADVLRDLYTPFVRTGNEVLVMDTASARGHEVRRQRHARHPDQLHEHDRAPVRALGRRCGHGAARCGFRPTDRPYLPVPRCGIRGVLFAQGRRGARPHA